MKTTLYKLTYLEKDSNIVKYKSFKRFYKVKSFLNRYKVLGVWKQVLDHDKYKLAKIW